MLEKYDGVRGFWNPLKKAFYTRVGRQLPLPQEIVDSMPPNIFLDGELWYFTVFFNGILRNELL